MKRLNVGCGVWLLRGYINLDANPALPAEIHATVPPLPFADGELDEIYAGHFLEHLGPEQAEEFVTECYRCLKPRGRLAIVVPDTFEVMRRYVLGMPDQVEFPEGHYRRVADLDEVCAMFLYSPIQDSPHRWSYDLRTLRQLMEAGGFVIEAEIDRYNDPRIPVGEFYQCGWDARKA